MSGYPDFVKKFKQGSFVSSSELSRKISLPKALSSLYIIPTFFRGTYYIPSLRERKGQFIDRPMEFFSNLFNFVYGRKNWYWALSTAARYYGSEWSATKILELVCVKESKTIDVLGRVVSLEKKTSYRSKILSKMLSSLSINLIVVHKGKKNFLNEIKIDDELGPVATKDRLRKDVEFFISKTKILSLRRLYRKYR